MKRIVAIITVFISMTFGAAILQSCSSDDGCGSFSPPLEAVDFGGSTLVITGVGDDDGRPFFTNRLYQREEVDYDSIGLNVFYALQELALDINPITFSKRAYACSPPVPYNEFNGFTIVSNKPYDASHPAGTDLSGLVYSSFNTGTSASNIPLGSFLEGGTIFFRFYRPPLESGIRDFTLTVHIVGKEDVSFNFQGLNIRR